MNIIDFLGPTLILLIIVLLSLILLIAILTILNKRLNKKVIQKEKYIVKEETERTEIENLKNSIKSPEEILNGLNIIIKKFLRENFKIKKNMDYYEMIPFFKKKNKDKIALLCQQMVEALYTGEMLKKEKVLQLIRNFEFIVKEEHPIIKKIEEQQSIKHIEENHAIKKVQEYYPTKERYYPIIESLEPQSEPIEPIETEADKIAKELSSIKEDKIMDSYRNLQRKFEIAYETALKNNIKENLEILNKLRQSLIKRVEEYSKDRFKIIELSEEISKGEEILRNILN